MQTSSQITKENTHVRFATVENLFIVEMLQFPKHKMQVRTFREKKARKITCLLEF